MRLKIFCLLAILLLSSPVFPQDSEIDCENVEAIKGNLSTALDQVTTLEELPAIVIAIRIVLVECHVEVPGFVFAPINTGSSTATPEGTQEALAGFTRSNPLPLGEWLTFDKGLVRVAGIDENYELSQYETYAPPEGMRLIVVNMEYLCQKADENETCRGIEVASSAAHIMADGTVIGTEPLYDSNGLSVTGHEAYAGATITGNIYFAIPEGEAPNIMRLNIIPSQPVFLSLH